MKKNVLTKVLGMVLCVAMLAVVLTACGGSGDSKSPVGTWKSKITLDTLLKGMASELGDSEGAEDTIKEVIKTFDMTIELELKDDNTAKISMKDVKLELADSLGESAGDVSPEELLGMSFPEESMKYTISDDGKTIDIDGLKFEFSGNKLTPIDAPEEAALLLNFTR